MHPEQSGPVDLVIRVAVTGHRPPRLSVENEEGIRHTVANLLTEIGSRALKIATQPDSLYSSATPGIVIVSSLAEGADRIVAQEGLKLGAALHCPLPAHRDVYRWDFCDPGSAQEFDELLEEAARVFELDNERNGRWLAPSAYAAVGHVLASQCDLLIAVWDGESGGEGGTEHVVRDALRMGVPVLRIDVDTPEVVELLSSGGGWHTISRHPEWRSALERSMDHSVGAPKGAQEWLHKYLSDRPEEGSELARADKASVRYGDLYRASYIAKYLFSALAVLFAVLGLRPTQEKVEMWAELEFVSIAVVLIWFLAAWRWKWHERWINYRMLAEQFRVLEYLAPLGQTVPGFRPPVFWHNTGRHAWAGWFFRAHLRRQGLTQATMTVDYLKHQRKLLHEAAVDQAEYHRKKKSRLHFWHSVTDTGGLLLFTITAVTCFLHFTGLSTLSSFILGAITAILPAFGASFEGLQAQAEWKRLAERSDQMQHYMTLLAHRLADDRNEFSFPGLSQLAVGLAEAMTGESSEWHYLIQGKPLHLS